MSGRQQVDVWVADAERLCGLRTGWLAMLSEAERVRAGQFVKAADAEAFVGRRVFMREVLASYLNVAPGSLTIVTQRGGRPRLRLDDPGRAFGFSISHSLRIAVCAVGRDPIGIDVERIREDIDWGPLVRRFFSAAERRLVERGGVEVFFRAWTLKEAAVKARGRTLAALPGVDVERALRGGTAIYDGLVLRSIDVRQGYAAALATPPTSSSIELRAWDPRVPAEVA